MKITNLLFLSGILLLLNYCSSGEVVKPPDPAPPDSYDTTVVIYDTVGIKYLGDDEILPLNEGNYWEYRWVQFYLDTSSVLKRKSFFRSSLFSEISDLQTNNHFKLISGFIEEDGASVESETSYLYNNTSNGLESFGAFAPQDTILLNSIYRQYPVQENDKWQYIRYGYFYLDEKFQIIDTISIECVSTDTTFITPIDTFQCILYKYRIIEDGGDYKNIDDHYAYYCPKVGLIGKEIYAINLINNSEFLFLKQELIKSNLIEYLIEESNK